VPLERVVCCGGIAEKNDLFMQIYADVIGMPMHTAGSPQTPALGAAIAAAVAAGGYPDFAEGQAKMTSPGTRTFAPDHSAHAVYDELYAMYRELHDTFGAVTGASTDLPSLMKRLLALREREAGAAA
jgi:L-ribulokinase